MIFQSPGGKGARAGAFWPALAASCALHVLLLWPDALPRAVPQAGQPLTATLRAAAVAEPPAAATPRVPARRDMPAAGNARAEIVAARREPLATPNPAPSIPAGAGTEAGTGAGMGGRESPGAAGPAEAKRPAFDGSPAPETLAQAGESVRPDADGIRAYRIGLAREARAYKRYPSLARERGWTGTAEVRVDVSRDGLPRQILLARSSGHDILDDEAVHMMSQAAAVAALPDALRGRAFAVRLPVVFDISGVQ